MAYRKGFLLPPKTKARLIQTTARRRPFLLSASEKAGLSASPNALWRGKTRGIVRDLKRESPSRFLVPRASRERPPRIEGAAQAAVPLSHRIADERPSPAAILQQSLPSIIDKHENMPGQHANSSRTQAFETAAAIAPAPPAIHPPSNGSPGECRPRQSMGRA